MNRAQVRKLTFGQLFLCLRQSHSVAKPDYFPFGHRPAMTALHRQACLRSAKRALEPEHVDERYVQSRVQILPVGSRGQSVEKTQRTRIAAPMEEHLWWSQCDGKTTKSIKLIFLENVNEMKMLVCTESSPHPQKHTTTSRYGLIEYAQTIGSAPLEHQQLN